MTPKDKRELSKDELELLRDEALPATEEELELSGDDEWDEWAGFRRLSEEEKKWALIQLQLDREQKYLENNYMQE